MTNNIYDYISLCEVMASKDDGGPTLLRLADIGENQKLQPFIFDESRLPKWDNRKYLFNRLFINTCG